MARLVTTVRFIVQVGSKGGIVYCKPRLGPRVNLLYNNGAYQVWHVPSYHLEPGSPKWEDFQPTAYYLVRVEPAQDPYKEPDTATIVLGEDVDRASGRGLRRRFIAEADRRARTEGRLAADAIVLTSERDWAELVAQIAKLLQVPHCLDVGHGILFLAGQTHVTDGGPMVVLDCPDWDVTVIQPWLVVGGVFPPGITNELADKYGDKYADGGPGPLILEVFSGPTALAKAIATQFLPSYRQRYEAAQAELRECCTDHVVASDGTQQARQIRKSPLCPDCSRGGGESTND